MNAEVEGFRQGLRNIAYDVFHLEINTIVKKNMTAQKMPPTAHAVLDIAADYVHFLRDLDPPILADTLRDFGPDRRTTSFRTFDTLKGIALELLKRNTELEFLDSENQVIVERIFRNSAHLSVIIKRFAAALPDAAGTGEVTTALPPGPVPGEIWNSNREGLYRIDASARRDVSPIQREVISPQDRAIIRKIWEIGTEKVVMQSVVQLDGDVITRVHAARLEDEHARLHELHQEGVDVAIRTWQTLVQTIGALVGGLASFFPKLLDRPG